MQTLAQLHRKLNRDAERTLAKHGKRWSNPWDLLEIIRIAKAEQAEELQAAAEHLYRRAMRY